MTKLFTGGLRRYAPRMSLRGWPHGSPTNPRWRRPPFWISGKMSITSYWIKISAANFVRRCITAMRRRDQNLKTRVNSHDVIKWMSGRKRCLSQWLQHVFEPNLVLSSSILDFGKNVNNSGLDTDYLHKIRWEDASRIEEMTTWPKVKTGS